MKEFWKKVKQVITVPIAVAFVFGALVFWSLGSAASYTSQDAFCGTCHDRTVEARDMTYHQTTACIDCHTKGPVADKVDGMRKVALTITGAVDPENDPLKADVPNDHCLSCHNVEDESLRSELIATEHKEYLASDKKCADCHAHHAHDLELMQEKYSELEMEWGTGR